MKSYAMTHAELLSRSLFDKPPGPDVLGPFTHTDGSLMRIIDGDPHEPPLRRAIDIARVAQTAAAIPAWSGVQTDAVVALRGALSDVPRGGTWCVHGTNNRISHAFSTSSVLIGFGDAAAAALGYASLDAVCSTLRRTLVDLTTPGHDEHLLLATLLARALDGLGRLDDPTRAAVGVWAERLLYQSDSRIRRERPVGLSGVELAAALAAAARHRPTAFTGSDVDAFVTLLVDHLPLLPYEARTNARSPVVYSSLEALLALLREDVTRVRLLDQPAYLAAVHDWVIDHSDVVGGTRLFIPDTAPQSEPQLWFCGAVAHFAHAIREHVLAAQRTVTLQDLRASVPDEPTRWGDLMVGGHPWPRILETSLLQPARDKIPEGGRIERNGVVLFGPPGTGKSTVAGAMARSLGDWPLVTLGPATFLRDGRDRIFARIEDLFSALAELTEVVVVMSELELLARPDSGDWASGLIADAIMPWLRRLHHWGRSVYILATSDIGYLDAAIRREGRLDFVVPVGPPSTEERAACVKAWVPWARDREVLVAATARATYRELQQWSAVVRSRGMEDAQALELWQSQFAPRLRVTSELFETYEEDCLKYSFPPEMVERPVEDAPEAPSREERAPSEPDDAPAARGEETVITRAPPAPEPDEA